MIYKETQTSPISSNMLRKELNDYGKASRDRLTVSAWLKLRRPKSSLTARLPELPPMCTKRLFSVRVGTVSLNFKTLKFMLIRPIRLRRFVCATASDGKQPMPAKSWIQLARCAWKAHLLWVAKQRLCLKTKKYGMEERLVQAEYSVPYFS